MPRPKPHFNQSVEKRQTGENDSTWTAAEAVNRTAVEVTAALSKIAETEEDEEDAPAAKSAKRGSPVKKKVVSPEARKSTVQPAVAPQNEKPGPATNAIFYKPCCWLGVTLVTLLFFILGHLTFC